MSMKGTIAPLTSTERSAASRKSNVGCVVSCTTKLDCVHIWPYNIRMNSRKTRHANGRAKLPCGAVWRVLNLKGNGTRYRESPRRGQAPTRLRQARITKNIAITRRVTRWHKYKAKCSALPQQSDQEIPCCSTRCAPGVYCCSAS